MRKKVFKKKKDMSPISKNIIGMTLSAIIGTVIALALSFVFSYTFANAEVLSDSIGAMFVACVLAGGFFCGIFASRLTTFKGIVAGILVSLIYSLFISVIMLFFSNGKLSANTIFLFIGTIIVSAIAGICGANIKRRK